VILMQSAQRKVRTESIGFRVAPRVKKAAARAAADDGRTLTSFIERTLADRLSELGYLPVVARRESAEPQA
jgi:predicted HicB family RNase H-like nuclease